jgi:Flp pilus assembly protein CpaB
MAERLSIVRKRRSKSGIAGVVAIVAAIVFSGYTIAASQRPIPMPNNQLPRLTRVPVLAEPVPAGTELGVARFNMVDYPIDDLEQTVVQDTELLSRAVALTAIPSGVPIDSRQLSLPEASRNPVIERIPPGMRAITIQVDATSAVEGWASSGTVVDVLLVTDTETSVIAEQVKILSAERSVTPVEEGTPVVPSTVTLLVTQEQTLAITTAIPLGRIAFALRSRADDSQWTQMQFTSGELRRNTKGTASKEGEINGFVSFSDAGEKKQFALSGDSWIKTDLVPGKFSPLSTK